MVDILKIYFQEKRQRWRFLLMLILTFLSSWCGMKETELVSLAVHTVGEDYLTAARYFVLVIGVLIACTISRTVAGVLMRYDQHEVFTRVNNELIDKLVSVDYSYFVDAGEGTVTSIIQSISSISNMGKYLKNAVWSLTTFGVVIVAIYRVKNWIVIPVLTLYIVVGVIISKVWKKLFVLDKEADELALRRNVEADKIVQGFVEVRSACTEEMHAGIVHNLNNEVMCAFKRKSKMSGASDYAFSALYDALTIGALGFSFVAIPSGLATATAMTIIIYAGNIVNPLGNVLDIADEISSAIATFKKYKKFTAIENKVVGGNIELTSFEKDIRFENVSFKYDKSETILDDVSFSVRKGESIGICGNSGGGKSTLLKLLPRFYDVTRGSIKIDGIDIREMTLDSLRKKIGIVHQESHIFAGTIRDNICYGLESVPETAVVEAAKKAHLYKFIMSLPNKFETEVGEKGLKLSGGQRQRVALARIFLQDPEIIVLDEATSALDNESEAIIQRSLKHFKNKTMITVAHRLTTIKDCDRIIVIDSHKIAEEGTHEELLAIDSGFYRHLWNIKDEIEDEI